MTKELANESIINNGAQEALVLTDSGCRLTAFWTRMFCGCGSIEQNFEPVFVMENILPLIDKSFNYIIVDKKEWKYSNTLVAFYSPESNKIIIRDDIYEGALSGKNLALITIAHEVVHCIQTIIMRILRALECVEFKTQFCSMDSEQMKNHEVQTDMIMSLVMAPEKLIKDKTDEEIVKEFFVEPLCIFITGIIKYAGKELKGFLQNQLPETLKLAV